MIISTMILYAAVGSILFVALPFAFAAFASVLQIFIDSTSGDLNRATEGIKNLLINLFFVVAILLLAYWVAYWGGL